MSIDINEAPVTNELTDRQSDVLDVLKQRWHAQGVAPSPIERVRVKVKVLGLRRDYP